MLTREEDPQIHAEASDDAGALRSEREVQINSEMHFPSARPKPESARDGIKLLPTIRTPHKSMYCDAVHEPTTTSNQAAPSASRPSGRRGKSRHDNVTISRRGKVGTTQKTVEEMKELEERGGGL